MAIMVAGCLAFAARSDAQQGWTGVESTPIVGGFSALGAAGAGNIRVVWDEPVGDGIHSVVRTTLRSAQTGTWSEPADAYLTSASHGVTCVQLVVDVAGNATASCAANSDTSTSTFLL